MACGKVITFNSGRDFQISDALPIAGIEWKELMSPIFRRLFEHCGDPAEWAPKETIQMYRYSRYIPPKE